LHGSALVYRVVNDTSIIVGYSDTSQKLPAARPTEGPSGLGKPGSLEDHFGANGAYKPGPLGGF
jgi:hypothetical protein